MVEHPGRESGGRVGEPVQRLRAQPHLERVADALRVEEVQLVEGALLLGRQTDRGWAAGSKDVRRQRLHGVGRDSAGHVGMDPEQARRCDGTHRVRDLRAPIAALRDVAGVAQTLHQRDPGLRDVDRTPAGRRRLGRVSVAGHRRNHDIERVLRVSAVRRGIAERADAR